MPLLSKRVHNLLKPFIRLLQKIVLVLFGKERIFALIFGRHAKDEGKGTTSVGSPTVHARNLCNKPPPSTPPNDYNPSLTPPIDDSSSIDDILSLTPPIDDNPSLIPPIDDNQASPTHPIDDPSLMPQTRSPKKRALLIGVETISEMVTEQGSGVPISRPLKGPHKDIRDMRKFLFDDWNYHSDDIVVLINTADGPEHTQPTKKNIERHCKKLVAGAIKGDQFFFHFAGHTTQKPTDGKEEEDGMDEYILTCDDEIIQDNNLRKMLVDPLPLGAKFVAIFDACNSGTLLDLEHHRCNRVYVPWVNKGFRRTASLWNIVVRRFAFGPLRSRSTDSPVNMVPVLESGSLSLHESQILSPTTLPAKIVAEVFPVALPPTQLRSATIFASPPNDTGSWFNFTETPTILYDSPDPYFCTGHCRTRIPQVPFEVSDKADVICLSSAKDCQRSWQDPQGSSMTQAFINYLKREPEATIEDVLRAVSHELHLFYVECLHHHARRYKRQMKEANSKRRKRGKPPFRRRTVEMDNFQDPQISSHIPLDMKRRWEM